jgi:hypothetical protein
MPRTIQITRINRNIKLERVDKVVKIVRKKRIIQLNAGGKRGLKGDAATIAVGETTTGLPGTDADVENVGTSSAAILDFTIPQGPVGPPGPQGSGVDKNYVQEFINSDDITVAHNLAKYPSVTVINSANDEVVGDIEYLGLNSLRVTFIGSFSGRVTCN